MQGKKGVPELDEDVNAPLVIVLVLAQLDLTSTSNLGERSREALANITDQLRNLGVPRPTNSRNVALNLLQSLLLGFHGRSGHLDLLQSPLVLFNHGWVGLVVKRHFGLLARKHILQCCQWNSSSYLHEEKSKEESI